MTHGFSEAYLTYIFSPKALHSLLVLSYTRKLFGTLIVRGRGFLTVKSPTKHKNVKNVALIRPRKGNQFTV